MINRLQKISFKKPKNSLPLALSTLLMLSQGLVFMSQASAKVLQRAHGRCLLSMNQSKVFDGHCVLKHMKNENGRAVVSVSLDNGKEYRFSGNNLNNLKIQA